MGRKEQVKMLTGHNVKSGVMFHHGQRRLTEYIFRYSFLADGEGKSSSSHSTNHNAGHQTAAGSLLMYRCDSVCVCSL